MQIWIRSGDKVFEPMEVESMDTVQALKERIRDIDGVPVECQRLTCAGQELKNSRVLADYNLKSQNSSLLSEALARGAGKVAQMLRENRTIDLEIVPLTLDKNSNKERGDVDAFIEENAARVSYLRARQQLFFKDRMSLSTVKVQEVAASSNRANIADAESSPRKLSDMKLPGSPAWSCASLATRAPSDDDSDLLSLPSSRSSSPCSSPGVSLEIDMVKFDISSNENKSVDEFVRENAARTSLLLKRLHERRMADGF